MTHGFFSESFCRFSKQFGDSSRKDTYLIHRFEISRVNKFIYIYIESYSWRITKFPLYFLFNTKTNGRKV